MDILGVSFGSYHTAEDWGLLLAGPASLSVPELSSNYIVVPGRNGPIDLTEALTGQPVYSSRTLTCSFFTVSTPEAWPLLLTEVLNAIHGKRMKIILDEDPDYYLDGRVSVGDVGYEDGAYSLTISAVCDPYKMKHQSTVITVPISTEGQTVILANDRKSVAPKITATADAELIYNGASTVIKANTPVEITDLVLGYGQNEVTVKATTETGSIRFEYQAGAL